MSRGKPNRVVRADWWDPDEDVTLPGSLSFGASQRAAFHAARVDELTASIDADHVEELTGHMVAVLLEVITSWRLRDTKIPYQEGIDRPVLGNGTPTTELLSDLDMEDVTYLFGVAIPKARGGAKDGLITQAAAQEGL